MQKLRFFPQLLPAVALLLSNCAAVYVPTVPATPLLEKGQVEMTAGLRSFRYAEVGAAWSPLPHLLLTTELAADVSTSTSSTTNAQGVTTSYRDLHRQGGVGMGLYTLTAKRSYLAVLGGIGWGHTNFFAADDYKPASVFLPLPLPTRQGVYDARYRRYYGQVYFAGPEAAPGPRIGGSLRTVWLDYAHLTYADQPYAPSTHVFVEPTVFVRFGQGPLRFFATGGFSMPLNSSLDDVAKKRTAATTYLFSGGIILRPDLLRRQQQ